jgi:3-dehydroquinate dehydratase-1/3-dehydroquinate dehydratase/shikimate dehydrogenase
MKNTHFQGPLPHRICVSIARKSAEEVVSAALAVSQYADVIEIRLDSLDILTLAPFFASLSQPLLLTNRPGWEGGEFIGDEGVRISPLLEGVERGCHYVDLELKAPNSSHQALFAAVNGSSTQLILSWHNFVETPSQAELVGRLAMIQDKGAHIAKIVTMAHDYHDVLRVLALQEEAARMDIPLVAFCMGAPGVISRLATLELGGYMTYCAASENEATAPGQLSVVVLRQIMELLNPCGERV